MNDMSAVIVPKSDQINADDLLAGPRTIMISRVIIKPGTEQPVSIFIEGETKAFRPCKSMCRVLVSLWGPDANAYVGRSMTLYNDPKVLWGGMAVGGIRISHMSDIEGSQTMALTATKGSKKPFTVKPLTVAPPVDKTAEAIRRIREKLDACANTAEVQKIEQSGSVQSALGDKAPAAVKAQVRGMLDAAYDRCTAPDDTDDFPGVVTPRDADAKMDQLTRSYGDPATMAAG